MRYPYVVANAIDLFDWVAVLPDVAEIRAYGYWGSANGETTLPAGYERICMACLLLQKKPAGDLSSSPPEVTLDLPTEFNAAQALHTRSG